MVPAMNRRSLAAFLAGGAFIPRSAFGMVTAREGSMADLYAGLPPLKPRTKIGEVEGFPIWEHDELVCGRIRRVFIIGDAEHKPFPYSPAIVEKLSELVQGYLTETPIELRQPVYASPYEQRFNLWNSWNS